MRHFAAPIWYTLFGMRPIVSCSLVLLVAGCAPRPRPSAAPAALPACTPDCCASCAACRAKPANKQLCDQCASCQSGCQCGLHNRVDQCKSLNLSASSVAAMTCWYSALPTPATAVLPEILFQLWLTGLNHEDGPGADRNHPILGVAVPELTHAIATAMVSPSQLMFFTGVDKIDDCYVSGTNSDDCIQNTFIQSTGLSVALMEPGSDWRAGSADGVEFGLLSSTPRWGVTDQGVTELGYPESSAKGHYNRGLWRIHFQDTCSDAQFTVFITHLNENGGMVQQLMAVLDEIERHPVGADDYAPLLIGDFNNAIDLANPAQQARVSSSFEQQDTENVTCKDGVIGAGKTSYHCEDPNPSHEETKDIKVLRGINSNASMFAITRGALLPIQKDFTVAADGTFVTACGAKVTHIMHTIRGLAFTTRTNPHAGSCPAGLTLCGQTGPCFNLSSDPNNCRTCGNVCPALDTCKHSQCVPRDRPRPCRCSDGFQPQGLDCGADCVAACKHGNHGSGCS
jgi:hypothetical protein